MKSFLSVCAMLLLASWMAACSVYMEATRPTPIDTGDYPTGMTPMRSSSSSALHT